MQGCKLYTKPSSNAYFITLFIVPSEPQSPNVQTIPGAPVQLFVSWLPPLEPNGVITAFTVYCHKTNESNEENFTSDGEVKTTTAPENATETTISGLTPYTFYECFVTANTSIGEGIASNSVIARTDESGEFL